MLQLPGAQPTSTSQVCVTEDVYSESPSACFIVVCHCDAAVRCYVTDNGHTQTTQTAANEAHSACTRPGSFTSRLRCVFFCPLPVSRLFTSLQCVESSSALTDCDAHWLLPWQPAHLPRVHMQINPAKNNSRKKAQH